MAEQTVTAKDGTQRRVIAPDEADLKDAVKSVEDYQDAPAFDINVPVMKGHDLLNPVLGSDKPALDGTGAHNSPRDAIRDDGSVEGSEPLFVVRSQDVAQPQMSEVTGSQETKDVSAEDVAATQNAVEKEVAEASDSSATNTPSKGRKADDATTENA